MTAQVLFSTILPKKTRTLMPLRASMDAENQTKYLQSGDILLCYYILLGII